MIIIYLNALRLNFSLFGRKYLLNNGVSEMAGLTTNASIVAYGPTII